MVTSKSLVLRVDAGHDLRTLAFALTNESHTLASACEAFGAEHKKHAAERHGVLTHEYIDYNRQDVAATGSLLERVIAEYRHHPIGLPPTKAYSPASIAKAYLQAMGIEPLLERQPDFPPEVLGYAMVAYYGGRAECRIRCQTEPVVYTDFLSMYPSVNALMGLWRYITADRIEVVDATTEVERLLARLTLADCFDPGFWLQLPTLVQLQPEGDVLPARADYGGNGQWQIGLNPLRCDQPLWYPLADVVDSTLLGKGRPPKILRAFRLEAKGTQRGLKRVQLAGKVEIDPGQGDFFTRLIEERRRTSLRDDLDPVERDRIRSFLKVLANSGCYGIFAEINREDLGTSPQPRTIYGIGEPFTQRLPAVEEPGTYSFPPLAACITAAARLMLGLLERLVTNAGGSYAFCDTDSMAIALPATQVEKIIDRFTALNPYNPELVPSSILELEEWNFNPHSGEREELYCFAISAKRYALHNLTPDGRIILRKPSEHGLGHLLNPLDLDSDDRDLARHVWQQILDPHDATDGLDAAWLDRPAVTRLTASAAATLRPFANYNQGRPYPDQIKAFNFLLSVHTAPFSHPTDYPPERFQLIAPYEADPQRWLEMEWTDRYSGHRFPIHTDGPPSPDSVKVLTNRESLLRYRRHPEPKSLDPDGNVCHPDSKGLLRRRPVTATHLIYIGKESNRLEEATAGLLHDLDEILDTYNDPALDPGGPSCCGPCAGSAPPKQQPAPPSTAERFNASLAVAANQDAPPQLASARLQPNSQLPLAGSPPLTHPWRPSAPT